jgi:hypothetical protein
VVAKTETLLRRREKNNAELRNRNDLPVLTFIEIHNLPSCALFETMVRGGGPNKEIKLFCLNCGVISKLESVDRKNLSILF